MIKRVGAWILILGFVFIIFDILVIGWQREAVGIIYAVIFIIYILFFSKSKNTKDMEESSNVDGEDDNIDKR